MLRGNGNPSGRRKLSGDELRIGLTLSQRRLLALDSGIHVKLWLPIIVYLGQRPTQGGAHGCAKVSEVQKAKSALSVAPHRHRACVLDPDEPRQNGGRNSEGL